MRILRDIILLAVTYIVEAVAAGGDYIVGRTGCSYFGSVGAVVL